MGGQVMSTLETKRYLDSLHGKPCHSMTESLQRHVKRIQKAKTYDEFFAGVGVRRPNDEELAAWLCQAVQNSERRGYHKLQWIRPKEKKKKISTDLDDIEDDEYADYGDAFDKM